MRARFLLASALALGVSASSLSVLTPSVARASVSIAVLFNALVKDAESVAIVTPVEQKSVWENGRICTYTKVRVDSPVSGNAKKGEEKWVRTLGGVIGKIGQSVEGEPTLTEGKPSLLFLHRRESEIFEVSARAQGQFPIVADAGKRVKLVKHAAMGTLVPPRVEGARLPVDAVRLAHEVLNDRDVDAATVEIQRVWQQLHTAESR